MQRREKMLLETDIVREGLYLDSRLNVVLSEEQCSKARALLKQTWKKIQKLCEKTIRRPDASLPLENPEEPGPSTRPQLNVTHINRDLIAIEEMLVRTEMSRGLSTGTMPSIDLCLRELRGLPSIPLDTNIIQH